MSVAFLSVRFTSFSGLILGSLLGFTGCASAPNSYRTGDHWSKDGYAWPGGGAASAQAVYPESHTASHVANAEHLAEEGESTPHLTRAVSNISPPKPVRALQLVGNECENELKRRGVHFRPLSELKGVENPVEIKGKLGGVNFWANDGRPLQLDCRLAVALDQLAEVFQTHGVRKIRYSGAYSYRSTKTGRLSHHAYGLAIDLHDFDLKRKSFSVNGGFQKNVGCQKGISALNALSCDMRDQALFEEFLTPDYNYDHRDHLHISVPRLTR